MSKISTLSVGMILFLLASGCAILQRESPEKKARAFMVSFQQSLSQEDNEVLKYFESDQSTESLLAAINLLQNEDSQLVECNADFNNMQLEVEEIDESIKKFFNLVHSAVKVTVPVLMLANLDGESRDVELVFWLREKNNQYVIYKMEAENFYSTFTSLKHDIQYAQHQQEELKNREAIYAFAQNLEERYDKVVWYTQYSGQLFYYVINGNWNEEFLYSSDVARPDFKMGLVNSEGKEIMPVVFDMIGTIGVEMDNAVEVKTQEGYGYVSLSGDTLVPPVYTQIIVTDGYWIVQSDGEFGWVDQNKKFIPGFPDQNIEQMILGFKYLPSGITIKEDAFALCEAPNQEGAGSGVFISPSSWVSAGLLEPFKSGITTTVTDAPIGGWTEYIELSETFFQSITENFGVLIASFKERYLEGREEFYEHKKLLFKDSMQNTLLAQEFSGESLEVKKVSDHLVEISSHYGYDEYFDGGLPIEGEMQGANFFRYFSVDDNNTMEEMTSNRSHPETEFVKLDDTYITGDFKLFVGEETGWQRLSVYPPEYLERMRNEILADYGVTFKKPEDQEYFKQFKWYTPRFDSESEIQDFLSEIDKHNLSFLAKAIQGKQGEVSL